MAEKESESNEQEIITSEPVTDNNENPTQIPQPATDIGDLESTEKGF